MKNSSSIFRKIDEFIFNQIENFKNSSIYQQVIELFSDQEDVVQKYINYISSTVIVLIPLLLILFFQIKNFNISNTVNIKRDIYNELGEISVKSKRLSKLSSSSIANKLLGYPPRSHKVLRSTPVTSAYNSGGKSI